MHPNATFRWNDEDAVRDFVREVGFATIFAATPDGPRVAHAPMIWTGERRLRFHLHRGNALTAHLDKVTALAVFNGPDAYISPDWYGIPDQVPTWNYLAVEIEGRCQRLDTGELVTLLDDLSDAHEARLAPKPAWTRGKMSPGRFEAMLKGIVGFELDPLDIRTTAKLGQNKSEAARHAAADALAEAGGTAAATLMRGWQA